MNQNSTQFNLRKGSLNFAAIIAVLAAGPVLAQPYINGGISTGATSKSGVAAPTGYTFSELQNDAGVLTMANGTTGVGAQIVGTTVNRVADDFTVPVGELWTLSKATFYAYQTNYTGTTSPFTEVRVRISSGNPSTGAPVVFGDMTTNRFLATSDAMMYRVGSSTAPAGGTAPALNRKIWKIEATVNVALPAGTYWIEWTLGAGAGGNFSPPSTIVDARTQPGYNAMQYQSATATWITLVDSGNPPDTTPDVAVDMPFQIDYALTLATAENELASKFSVYPNPARDVLTVSSTEIAESAEIHDIAGRLVKSVTLGNVVNDVNVGDLSSGSYIMTINAAGSKVVKKFIKE